MMSESPTHWRTVFSSANTDILSVNSEYPVITNFPARAPSSWLSRINPNDPLDPLLLQILPDEKENQQYPDFVSDPTGDLMATPVTGLLHKYHGRVLLILTSACAIHCRYCFRRSFPYQENHMGAEVFEYIAHDSSITEVILSGGDPLSLTDIKLAEIVQNIEKISHVHTLRIHTRLPVVIPQRVNQDLLAWLAKGRLKKVVVLHINHANEIDDAVVEAVQKLKQTQIWVYNQSVLLKGVNDNSTTLIELSQKLFNSGIQPYYLHLLDKVRGVKHFEVSEQKAISLIQEIRDRLPGYLVPELVYEKAGENSKLPL
jgi:L-lysine 2,3-aminomutase